MAMFGSNALRVPGDLTSDPNFGSDFGATLASRPGPDLGGNIAGAVPKQKFFGEGGAGRPILGAIGDAMSAFGGGQPIYAQEMARRRADQRDAQRQEAELERWKKMKLWEQTNATPAQSATPTQSATPIQSANPIQTGATDMASPEAKGLALPGGAPMVRRLSNGPTAYWINGHWYDNLEGR